MNPYTSASDDIYVHRSSSQEAMFGWGMLAGSILTCTVTLLGVIAASL